MYVDIYRGYIEKYAFKRFYKRRNTGVFFRYGITGNAIIIPSYVNLGDEFTYEDGERFAAGETYRVLFNYNIDKDNYTEGQDLVVKFNGNVATKTISPLDGETEYYETLITLPGGTKYTVTFETYGGAPVPENQLVLEGKKATKPSTTMRIVFNCKKS